MIAQSEETTGTKKWSFTPWKNFWPLPFSESAVETPPMGPKRQKGTKIDWIPRKAEKLFERFHNPSFSAKNVEMGWLAAGMDAADLAGRLSEPQRAMYLQAVSTSTQTRQITATHAPYDSTSPLPSARKNWRTRKIQWRPADVNVLHYAMCHAMY